MKIELIKNIKLYQMEFVGEVDFFEASPYIKLLENIKTEDELKDELNSKNMSESAIKNIIQNLTDLKVLKDGELVDVKDGFPEKEYGKYSFEIFENDTKLPFQFKNKDIKREKAVSKNIADDIKFLDVILLKNCKTRSEKFQDGKEFQIIDIEKNKGTTNNVQLQQLSIKYEKNNWKYTLVNKSFDMQSIPFDDIFKEWDENEKALKVSFDEIKENDNYIETFLYNLDTELEFDGYGKFNSTCSDIPIIPKTNADAKDWLLYLLKKEIEKKERYISTAEVEQMWFNLLDKKPQLKKYDLKFKFDMILKEFGKDSKYYWLLKTGIDLYPFNDSISPKDRIIIEKMEDFRKFNFYIEKVVIFDRYINAVRHFKKLEEILQIMDNPEIQIYTTEYKNSSGNEINEIIEKNKIERVIKEKNQIPHSRYWIFNDKYFYKVSESLDSIESTSFDLYDIEDIKKIDSKIFELYDMEKK